MNKEPTPQLGFKPRRFGGHDLPCISQLHQFRYGGRIERESHLALTTAYKPLQFYQTSNAANELNTLVIAGVSDP
jgi:hypothetical protein